MEGLLGVQYRCLWFFTVRTRMKEEWMNSKTTVSSRVQFGWNINHDAQFELFSSLPPSIPFFFPFLFLYSFVFPPHPSLFLSRDSCSPGWPRAHCMAQDDIEFLSFNLQNSGVRDVYRNVNWLMRHWRLKSWLSVQQASIIPTELYPQYHIFLFIMFLHCHKILEDGPELLDICGCL